MVAKVTEKRVLPPVVDERLDARVLEAHPTKKRPDYEEMRARAKRKFSKTLAYLAK